MPPQGGRKHPQQEVIPINTTNVLFICGGAFDGLDKIIEKRLDKSAIGFNSPRYPFSPQYPVHLQERSPDFQQMPE